MQGLLRIFIKHEIFKVAFDGIVQRNFRGFADERHVSRGILVVAAELVGQKKYLVQSGGVPTKRRVAIDGIQNLFIDNIEGFYSDNARNSLMQK